MKPKKKIIIHNPHLIRIRMNLRALLEQAYLSRLSSMSCQSDKYRRMRERGESDPTEEEKLLSKAKSKLMEAYTHSILFCNLGAFCFSENGKSREQINTIKLERDMVWAPWLGGWICLQCYNHFCIQQYDFDKKERDHYEEKKLNEFLRKHDAL